MDDDPKKHSTVCSTLCMVLPNINTDGEIIRIDLLSRQMKYNEFSFIRM